MRRIIKNIESIVLKEGLTYKVNGDNSSLRKAILDEQLRFCAYTDTYIGRSDKFDLDHFNPKLKGKEEDNYENWYAVKAQWNSEKASKWEKYQPVIPPNHPALEERIIYFEGDYIVADQNDIEASNLIQLLKLDDPDLAVERKRYIARRKNEINCAKINAKEYFEVLLNDDMGDVRFIRAIREEFGVQIEEIIKEMEDRLSA
jgi:hypothetical protein